MRQQDRLQTVPWSAGTEPPKLKAPPNACDCHMHIYDSRFPVAPNAKLSLPMRRSTTIACLQKRIGTTRNVVVTPSTYGTDNSCTLDAMAKLGPSARGVAVVDTSVTDAELKRLNGLGIRGIRFNLVQSGATTIDMLEPLSKRVNDLGWHVQIHMLGEQIVEAADLLQRLPSPIVFDHMARIPEPAGVDHPAFALVMRLLDRGRTWVKLSGAYMDTKVGPPSYADVSKVARAYVKAAPERLVWAQRLAPPDRKGRFQARRRRPVRPHEPLGARRSDPQSDPGRQSRRALWVRVAQRAVDRRSPDAAQRRAAGALNFERLRYCEKTEINVICFYWTERRRATGGVPIEDGDAGWNRRHR